MPPHRRSDPGRGSGTPHYPGTFLLAFREAAAGLGWQVRRWLGETVECADAEGKPLTVGVENLYRRARRADRADWPALITEFLHTVGSAGQATNLPTDLANVAAQLLVRLGPPLSAPLGEGKVWSHPLNDTDLCVSLVVDFPDRLCYVTDQLVENSGQPGTVWLRQALVNLQARTPTDCFQMVDAESGIQICGVADAYDTSRALLLDDLLPETRAEGFFVALPGRDELLVLPVSAPALAHVHLLRVLAEKNFRSTPYPISPHVYWVQRGSWYHFPIEIQGQSVAIQPPEAFVAVLKRLLPGEGFSGPDESPDEDHRDPEVPL
jgi:hypothetical protein